MAIAIQFETCVIEYFNAFKFVSPAFYFWSENLLIKHKVSIVCIPLTHEHCVLIFNKENDRSGQDIGWKMHIAKAYKKKCSK